MKSKLHERKIIAFVEDGTFEIDSQGRIWRLKDRKGGKAFEIPRRRAEDQHKRGYLRIRVRIKGKRVEILAHRLIWQYFNGNIPNGFEINHKNGNKTDNRLVNLEVVTPSENHTHAYKTGLKKAGEKHPRAKLTNRQVKRIRRLWASGKYEQKELAKKFHVAQTAISKIVTRKRWNHI